MVQANRRSDIGKPAFLFMLRALGVDENAPESPIAQFLRRYDVGTGAYDLDRIVDDLGHYSTAIERIEQRERADAATKRRRLGLKALAGLN